MSNNINNSNCIFKALKHTLHHLSPLNKDPIKAPLREPPGNTRSLKFRRIQNVLSLTPIYSLFFSSLYSSLLLVVLLWLLFSAGVIAVGGVDGVLVVVLLLLLLLFSEMAIRLSLEQERWIAAQMEVLQSHKF